MLYNIKKSFAIHHINVDKYKIYFEEYGVPDGIPVLFLHGGPGSGCSDGFINDGHGSAAGTHPDRLLADRSAHHGGILGAIGLHRLGPRLSRSLAPRGLP